MNEYLRKISHLLFGLLIAGVIGIFPKNEALAIIAVSLSVGLILIDLCIKEYRIPVIYELILTMERDGAFPGKGALFFVCTSLCILVIFSSLIAAISVGVLAILDCFATIVGIRYGTHKIYNNKSLEGFLGGFIIATISLAIFISPILALVIAFIAGISELLSPVDDNLIIPWVVAILITILTNI